MHPLRLAVLLILTLCALALAGCESETYERPSGPGNWVLVDMYHTRLQNPQDHRLYKWNYAYQGVHGYSRLFDHLEDNGYPWSGIRDMRLSAERLEGFDVLFINLLHDQRPDFDAEELEAIQAHVKNGGGLVMIVDHTNVYRHAERANRVLAPMGIEALYHSALDFGSHSVSGTGWIAIKNLAEHPTNEGVEMISFQTGGPVNKEHGTAFLSERGFADFWNEEETKGFYGNWKHDGDDKLEPKGKDVALVAAAQYGKGRVVVIGDQNIYGDAWLHFGDNFKHVLNVFEWAASKDQGESPLRDTIPKGLNIGHDINFSEYSPGQSGFQDYYAMFVNWNRDQGVTARGTLHPNPKLHDAYVLTTPSKSPTPQELEQIQGYLDAGKRVVLSFEANKISRFKATLEVIKALAPEFSLEVNDQTVRFDQDIAALTQQLSSLSIPQHAAPVRLTSSVLDVDDLEVAAYTRKRVKDKDDELTPYMLKVKSSWGSPMLQSKGERWDIMRRKRVGPGELIIVLQDGFWKNQTLGTKETSPPESEAVDAVKLHYAFIDHLKTAIQ